MFEQWLNDWGYLGVFLSLLATGLGFPMPEEIPVVVGGALVGSSDSFRAIYMIPCCIAGVILGDICLYLIGRLWGAKLVESAFLQKRFLPPERMAKITENFQKYGIKILLFARLTPGIRAPIFITAGITRLPFHQFLLADGIYALPGVGLLFLLGYWSADHIKTLTAQINQVKSWLVLGGLLIAVLYFTYRFLRRPMVTGSPQDVPTIMEPVSHTLNTIAEPILHANRPKPEASPHETAPAKVATDPQTFPGGDR